MTIRSRTLANKQQVTAQKPNNQLILGYDLDMWSIFGERIPIVTDISPKTNSHTILCGMSGSGKSYHEQMLIRNLILTEPDGKDIFYFADYKGDDSFSYLRDAPRYYQFKNCLGALDEVYTIQTQRLAGWLF